MKELQELYFQTRARTRAMSFALEKEDHVAQPIVDVSPPKWHLAHTTWFFENFVLKSYAKGYTSFHGKYDYIFNSYYESLGERVLRTDRGSLTRPTVAEVLNYRDYVDEAMQKCFADLSPEAARLIMMGIQHEQQHQELFITDAKYILGNNPLYPSCGLEDFLSPISLGSFAGEEFNEIEGVMEIGFDGEGFCFDNELFPHKAYINPCKVRNRLVTNAEYLDFMEGGGYRDFRHWLSEGWTWAQEHSVTAPLYWTHKEGTWFHYTFNGLRPLPADEPVNHISYYEADAFARWAGCRLATEFEWEASRKAGLVREEGRWEWTGSAYLPYPGFRIVAGAIGEYNGKFMSGQMVLRGDSQATPPGHSRPTYRNFFHPDKQWQYSGIRLARTAMD